MREILLVGVVHRDCWLVRWHRVALSTGSKSRSEMSSLLVLNDG